MLRQLNGELPLMSVSPPREDVQDEQAPIDDVDIGHLRDGAHLIRAQVLIKNDQVTVELHGQQEELIELTSTHHKLRVIGLPSL